MIIKTICFNCREYSQYNKENNCFRCQSEMIAKVGTAFRPPKKKDIKSWATLEHIYQLQINKYPSTEPTRYFTGFAPNRFYNGIKRGTEINIKFKEKATIEALKRSYQC